MRGAAAFALALAAGAGVAAASSLPVVLDGAFREWRGLEPAVDDPAGDGAPGGLDLGRLWLADDGEALYLRLEVGRETILQNPAAEAAGSELRLYLDLDASAATGLPVEGLGAEIEVRFGERRVLFYEPDGTGESVGGGRAGVTGLPTHSAEAFEIRVPLPDGVETGDLAIVAVEETGGGDRLPDAGAVAYRVSDRELGPPASIGLERKKKTDLRILTLNVNDTTIAQRPSVYRRLFQAVGPDVIVLQELTEWGPGELLEFLAPVLPAPQTGWTAAGFADVVTATTFPLLAAAAVDGNLVVHLDLPGDRDLVIFNVHLPCCGNEAARDLESDNLAAYWRDLLADEAPFQIGRGDGVVFTGDFNFVGYRRQLEAIRDGRFTDPARGPDFNPGRSRGSLATAPLRHVAARTKITWRRAASPFAPGRLDWLFYSADALRHRKSFVLETTALPRRERKAAGLRRRDTDRASDHLPLVVDFRVR